MFGLVPSSLFDAFQDVKATFDHIEHFVTSSKLTDFSGLSFGIMLVPNSRKYMTFFIILMQKCNNIFKKCGFYSHQLSHLLSFYTSHMSAA